MPEIKLYKSYKRALTLILGCGAFVAGGFFILKEHPYVGWANIGFFGLGVIVGFFQLLDWRPQIIINEFGIFDRNSLKDFINWELIHDAYIINIAGQEFICLVIDKDYKPSIKKGKLFKFAAKLNEEIGAQEVNLHLGQINIKSSRLLEFILKAKDADSSMMQKLLSSKI